MIKALTIVGLLIFIAAGTALLYRNQPYSIKFEHEAEVKNVASTPPPPTVIVQPFGPVPHITVQAVPAPEPVAETPVKVVKKRKPKPSAAKRLESKWVAPVAKPFSFGDLFNVR